MENQPSGSGVTWVPVAEFFVPGEPKAQPRVRVVRGGHAYTPATAKGFKERIYWEAKSHCPQPVGDSDTPIRVDITFFLKRPKRLCRKKDPQGPVYCTKKPDRDNLDKSVLDALTGAGALLDDAQVVSGTLEKYYHAIGEGPGVFISIYMGRFFVAGEA
jgi:Holliday junction resolvase RusA-like endonuclease